MLGFNWALLLSDFLDTFSPQSTMKYRSALFYLNYSVRQMRIPTDVDLLIGRMQSQVDKKLRRLDLYPVQQNFCEARTDA